MLKRKYNEDVQIKFSDLKMDHFFNSKSDLKGVDFNDPFIDSDINLNPDSIDLYLKNALGIFFTISKMIFKITTNLPLMHR
ncbi:hypothetical protein HZS_6466 [Henneguya salminicola]|nr:hypothetical protein HZS_6466 [Henneguya salminicola]